MRILAIILVLIVAIEHVGIMGLEMVGPSRMVSKAFNMPEEVVSDPNVHVALSNQGVYNGFVALALLLALFIPTGNVMKVLLLCFLGFVMVAAIYGGLTVYRKIMLIQGGPAFIAFLLVLFFI
ncbi:DUF1304 domain-containing protein [Pediococcus argentinicus]|uniref:DUF1304 domain-containing protein n=1 Tax=Pediococcus argentinicus TaxID=480391 RepID=UPI00338FCBCA